MEKCCSNSFIKESQAGSGADHALPQVAMGIYEHANDTGNFIGRI